MKKILIIGFVFCSLNAAYRVAGLFKCIPQPCESSASCSFQECSKENSGYPFEMENTELLEPTCEYSERFQEKVCICNRKRFGELQKKVLGCGFWFVQKGEKKIRA